MSLWWWGFPSSWERAAHVIKLGRAATHGDLQPPSRECPGLCQPRHCQAGLWGCTSHPNKMDYRCGQRSELSEAPDLSSEAGLFSKCLWAPSTMKQEGFNRQDLTVEFANPNSQAGIGAALPSCLCQCCKCSLQQRPKPGPKPQPPHTSTVRFVPKAKSGLIISSWSWVLHWKGVGGAGAPLLLALPPWPGKAYRSCGMALESHGHVEWEPGVRGESRPK